MLADMFTSHSPYHFGYNNPISFADPTGLASNTGGDLDSEILPEIIINVPPQIPPVGGFPSPPPFFGNLYDQVGIYYPYNPEESTLLPEIIINTKRKKQEAKNDYTNNEVDLKTVNQNINNFVLANSFKTNLIEYGAKTEELTKAAGKYLKLYKGVGTAGTFINTGYTIYQVYNNPTAGNTTRLVVQGIAIGTADMMFGDEFYEWIDKR